MDPTFTRACFTDMRGGIRTCSERSAGRNLAGGCPLRWSALGGVLVAWVMHLAMELPGAESVVPDLGALPPPASHAVDFLRQIQPILERSCLRCHGPERPRGGLRLDTREHWLRGADSGPVVVISNSAASRLIHVVARLPGVPEDLWMPPEGKALRLTPEEVGLLRAWIDQGLPWATSPGAKSDRVELTLGMGWWGGSGPASIGRAWWQQPSGWNGGLESLFWAHEPPEGLRLSLQARALRDDGLLQIEGRLPQWGWLRAGVSEYRRYDLDRGLWPWAPGQPVGVLDHAPVLDIGRSWIELGLDRPDWPHMSLGYEHSYREGTRSLTSWSAGPDPGIRRLLWPAFLSLDEDAHILRFHVRHEMAGWQWEDELRIQWSESSARRTNVLFSPPESDARFLAEVRQRQESFQAANAFRFERPLRPWLRATGGYLYSRHDADGQFQLEETPLALAPGMARRWRSPSILLKQTGHAGNANLIAEPGFGWVLAAGLQTDWTRQHGLGRPFFEYEFTPSDWFVQEASQESARDRFALTEVISLRYQRLRHAVLFAEARAEQESIEHFEEQLGGAPEFRRDTMATGRAWDGRVGAEVTPWSGVRLGASYRHRQRHTEYDHRVDLIPTDFGTFPNPSYSAFLRDRELRSDQVELRLAWQPSLRLRLAALYRYLRSTSHTATDALEGFDPDTFELVPGFYTPGTRILGGASDVHTYALQLGFRPAARWSFRLHGALQESRTRSALDDNWTLPTWAGRTYQLQGLGQWHWNERTDLEFQYQWAMSDFHRDLPETALPLGTLWREQLATVSIRRRCRDDLIVQVRYGLWKYDEPTAGGSNDVLAHLAWVSLTWQWP